MRVWRAFEKVKRPLYSGLPLVKNAPFLKISPQPCSLRWEIPSGGGRPFMPWTLSSALGSRTADFWRMLNDDVNLPIDRFSS